MDRPFRQVISLCSLPALSPAYYLYIWLTFPCTWVGGCFCDVFVSVSISPCHSLLPYGIDWCGGVVPGRSSFPSLFVLLCYRFLSASNLSLSAIHFSLPPHHYTLLHTCLAQRWFWDGLLSSLLISCAATGRLLFCCSIGFPAGTLHTAFTFSVSFSPLPAFSFAHYPALHLLEFVTLPLPYIDLPIYSPTFIHCLWPAGVRTSYSHVRVRSSVRSVVCSTLSLFCCFLFVVHVAVHCFYFLHLRSSILPVILVVSPSAAPTFPPSLPFLAVSPSPSWPSTTLYAWLCALPGSSPHVVTYVTNLLIPHFAFLFIPVVVRCSLRMSLECSRVRSVQVMSFSHSVGR